LHAEIIYVLQFGSADFSERWCQPKGVV